MFITNNLKGFVELNIAYSRKMLSISGNMKKATYIFNENVVLQTNNSLRLGLP